MLAIDRPSKPRSRRGASPVAELPPCSTSRTTKRTRVRRRRLSRRRWELRVRDDFRGGANVLVDNLESMVSAGDGAACGAATAPAADSPRFSPELAGGRIQRARRGRRARAAELPHTEQRRLLHGRVVHGHLEHGRAQRDGEGLLRDRGKQENWGSCFGTYAFESHAIDRLRCFDQRLQRPHPLALDAGPRRSLRRGPATLARFI